jgi:hypothetical protein
MLTVSVHICADFERFHATDQNCLILEMCVGVPLNPAASRALRDCGAGFLLNF